MHDRTLHNNAHLNMLCILCSEAVFFKGYVELLLQFFVALAKT